MLKFDMIRAPKAIAGFVKHFWVLEGNFTKEEPFVYGALAESCPEFIFYYKGIFKHIIDNNEQKCFRSGVYRQKRSFGQFIVAQDFGIFRVSLYSYTISQLFQLPTPEISDQSSKLKTLYGKEGEILEEKVILESDNAIRVQLVSEFLIKRMVHVRAEYSNILNTIRDTINKNYPCSIEEVSK
ncbi:DUF6597 domain-containing transcriptional factor [Galbibacter pacificus]|uniref:DUF6597 domain-containing protein n=1 Tax=Galbibacter pacificus TaxID=2996052 RepID=A0ABT6FR09_9FLAO|nr:DUF6597 domain-containing transcriptional factor [Galbibacter pacificus]MDG3581820.1 hypothetical protein [Galbibacter pacificus]MDG3585706.1 hypothetical protein [Galbibacter pacificus]